MGLLKLFRSVIMLFIFLLTWQLIVSSTGVPTYILPSPWLVGQALYQRADIILMHAAITLIEILAGLAIGILLGSLSALVLSYFQQTRKWLLPLLVISQAIPVFAIAPILVLWLGYGMISKIAMAVLIIYFPVTAAFFDGLRKTNPGYLDLAQTMNASRWAILKYIRIPSALGSFSSGLRVATAVAPIGAIVGEWVGSSGGLGYLMLHANGRLQIDLMFAALFVLAVMAVVLYYIVDKSLKQLHYW